MHERNTFYVYFSILLIQLCESMLCVHFVKAQYIIRTNHSPMQLRPETDAEQLVFVTVRENIGKEIFLFDFYSAFGAYTYCVWL